MMRRSSVVSPFLWMTSYAFRIIAPTSYFIAMRYHTGLSNIRSRLNILRSRVAETHDNKELYTTVSFFSFVEISNPDALVSKAEEALRSIDVKGTLLIANEGYNGQFAVKTKNLSDFKSTLYSISHFMGNIELNVAKTSTFDESEFPFKKLIVKKRKFILTDNYNLDLDFKNSGKELPAEEWHELITSSVGKNSSLIIDCRNDYESEEGTFLGANPLNTKIFSESWVALDKALENVPRDTPIMTFCTGGIRCRKTNAYIIQQKGFNNVVSLKHGIIGYNRWIEEKTTAMNSSGSENNKGIKSVFLGRNYIFDRSKMKKRQLQQQEHQFEEEH